MAGLDVSHDDPRLPDLSGLGAIIAAVVVFSGGTALVYLLRVLPRSFRLLHDAIPVKSDFYALCGVLALILAMCLFQLRERARGVYAALEMAFAAATAWVSAGKVTTASDMDVWFGFMGAAYLAVRALDNLSTAKKQWAWPWSLFVRADWKRLSHLRQPIIAWRRRKSTLGARTWRKHEGIPKPNVLARNVTTAV